MFRLLVAIPFALFFGMLPQDAATPDKPIPPDAAAMTNPVHPTLESQARAKLMFNFDCALCHGAKGDGKGDVVDDMKLTMKDWTASPSPLSSMKDGELFYLIKNGKGKMPPESGRAKDEDLWNVVIYIRSLTKP